MDVNVSKIAQNDVLHLTSNIQPKKQPRIMVFGTQNYFQFVYSDLANSLNTLFLTHAMGIKRLKNHPE